MNKFIKTKPSEGVKAVLRFMGPDGNPMKGFGSSLAVDPWKQRMQEVAREKRKKRFYKIFLVIQAIISYCAKKVFLSTD